MKAFVREISSRPSCAACAFKGIERPSDITVFDCYEYSKSPEEKMIIEGIHQYLCILKKVERF